MNSLRKTLLALSLLAAVSATTVEAAWYYPEWLSNFVSARAEQATKLASGSATYVNEHRAATAAAVVGTAAVAGGVAYLAKKYPAKAKAVVNAPRDLAKAAYGRFNKLSGKKKAAVGICTAVVVGGLTYLAYNYFKGAKTV